MSDIRKTLAQLADSIEAIHEQKDQKPKILDRSLSGNTINGGKITQFSSQGIEDLADRTVLKIDNNGIHTKRLYCPSVEGSITVEGDLEVKGNLITDIDFAEFNNKKTLELVDTDKNTFDEGIIWRNKKHTSQLVLKDNPYRVWTNESIDIARGSEYRIGNQTVVTEASLGSSIIDSKLKSVGKLRELDTVGSVTVGDVIRFDPINENISIGTEDSIGFVTIDSLDHKLYLDYSESVWHLGTYTSSNFALVTDDTVRISIANTGKVAISSDTSFENKVSIGVKNPLQDVDFTVKGAIRFNDKKQEVGSAEPTVGEYKKGDIVWNTDPKPTGYVGWICVREGTPGDWKPFGQIAS
jgi:hypothetical protein